MKTVRIVAWGLALVIGLAGGTALAAEEVTMKGQFVWERSDRDIPGDLEAVFTPAGEGMWDVVFRFEWDGEPREWKGSAQGSLDSGSLEGEGVEERDRKRTFVFEGTVEDGVFTGRHGALRDGEMSESGSLTLGR